MHRVDAHTKVWAAGVQASPLARCSPRPRAPSATGPGASRSTRLLAARPPRGLRDRRHDVARRPAGRGRGRDAAGIHAARTIEHRVRGEEVEAVQVPRSGQHGDDLALSRDVSFKGIRVAGFLGWLMWLFVHLAFLTGFKNRFTTVLSWGLTFIGGAERADAHRPAGHRPGCDRRGRTAAVPAPASPGTAEPKGNSARRPGPCRMARRARPPDPVPLDHQRGRSAQRHHPRRSSQALRARPAADPSSPIPVATPR